MKYVYIVEIKDQPGKICVVGKNWKEARNILKSKTGILIKNMKWLWCDFSKLELSVNPEYYNQEDSK